MVWPAKSIDLMVLLGQIINRIGARKEGEGKMKKVLIPTKLDKAAVEILMQDGAYEVVQNDNAGLPALAAQHPDTYALIVRSEKVDAAIIDALPALKVVIRAGSGFDTIDTRYARKKNIDVMTTPGANANAVAEEAVALMLADARHIVKADISTRAGGWEKKAFMGRELARKTVGIVGLGNIGRLVARRLAGFEMRLLGFDPFMSTERAAELNVELTTIERIFAESDYVTLHVPENDDTHGMVDAGLLALMKKGATIINCARAGIIDEAALRKAKAEKGLRFLNDVYPRDEPGPKSVADIADIMLPHLGASTKEANLNAAIRAAEELIELDERGITAFIVNRDIPEGLDPEFCDLANTLARLSRCLLGREAKLNAMHTSFYGSLKPFADWLLVSIVAGLWDEIDRPADARIAQKMMSERGIEYRDRETDDRKGFESSITVDLLATVGTASLRQVSVRGTVAEKTIMISRINEFDKLYFEPKGHVAMFEYADRPGVVGSVGARLAEAGINIEDIRHSHNIGSNRSLVIVKVNKTVTEDVTRRIASEIKASLGIAIDL